MVGCWAKATPVAAAGEGWLLMVSAAGAGPAVMVIVVEVALASDGALKFSVRSPSMPTIPNVPKLAKPLALVVEVRFPVSVPPPVAIAAVTTTPAVVTTVPEASRSWTTGCTAKNAPLTAEADGWVMMTSCVATGVLGWGTTLEDSVLQPAHQR